MLDKRGGDKESVKAPGEPPRYFIDLEESEKERSMALVIAARKCYAHQQADADVGPQATEAREHIRQIVEHCRTTPDYMLPDTPLKEAIFRAILGADNRPMSAEEISEELSARWSAGHSPRDTSPRVIQRLLENSQSYGIMRAPEPEVEEALAEEESAPAIPAEAESPE